MTVLDRSAHAWWPAPDSEARRLAIATPVVDTAAVLVAAAVGVLARHAAPLPASPHHETTGWVTVAVVVAVWLLAIRLGGGHLPAVLAAGAGEARALLRATVLTVAVVGLGLYLLRHPLSRGFFLVTFTLGPVLLLCGRVAVRAHLQRRRGDVAA